MLSDQIAIAIFNVFVFDAISIFAYYYFKAVFWAFAIVATFYERIFAVKFGFNSAFIYHLATICKISKFELRIKFEKDSTIFNVLFSFIRCGKFC